MGLAKLYPELNLETGFGHMDLESLLPPHLQGENAIIHARRQQTRKVHWTVGADILCLDCAAIMYPWSDIAERLLMLFCGRDLPRRLDWENDAHFLGAIHRAFRMELPADKSPW